MKSGSHGGRAAAAFGAIGLIIVTLGINISANSISAANDLMAFCPRYINIRRGQLLAAFIGSWAFVPVSLLFRTLLHEIFAEHILVENSCIGREIPSILRRLYHIPWADDLNSYDRVSCPNV